MPSSDMQFSAKHTDEWYRAVRAKALRRKRREIKERCSDILNDPCNAHNAHPYRDEYEGYWGAQLDAMTRIMYTIDENEGIVTFCTIVKIH
jgi:Txe/YoeB family toxin of Txe-Axe toxin-antitoxin module